MIAQMTLAEIQAKYAGVHTPDEVAQYQQNMTNSDKWKVKKNEWTWEGLTHVQLRGLPTRDAVAGADRGERYGRSQAPFFSATARKIRRHRGGGRRAGARNCRGSDRSRPRHGPVAPRARGRREPARPVVER